MSPRSLFMRLLILSALTVLAGFTLFLAEPSYSHFFSSTGRFVAQVGVAVGVLPNEYNSTAEQLRDRQIELDVRERAIREREAEMGRIKAEDPLIRYTLILTGFLIILVGANMWLDLSDHHRASPVEESLTPVTS